MQFANIALIEELYSRYQRDPESVDSSWRHFFAGIDFGAHLGEPTPDRSQVRIFDLIQAYRRYGHLLAHFNPLEERAESVPELELEKWGFFQSELDEPFFGLNGEASLRDIIGALKEIYCTRIGFEYMDLGHPDLEKWMQSRIEPKLIIQPTIEEKHLLLEYLNKSEFFETFLHTKYVGQTRFSLEGAESMIPLLAEMINFGGDLGVEDFLIGMAHRGRLNVLTNILNKPLSLLFGEFEDDMTLSYAGNDDVRYHMGFVGELATRSGKKMGVELAANPSHLESVDPVILGQTFATQVTKKDESKQKTVPIMIHGDASIAGQGVVYESLQLMNLPAYSVGGTIHLVVNNQIGYTTLPREGRSTRYCTDIAKTFSCPVFHVNAEDPESCLFVAKLAVEIRQKFQTDVFIDLLCYRKYGHNEGDEPSFTQPVEYQKIRAKKPIRQIYFEELLKQGALEQKMAEALEIQFKELLKTELEKAKAKPADKEKEKVLALETIETAVDAKIVQDVVALFCQVPDRFHLHPKLQKWLSDRRESIEKGIDWATAEMLAFGSLLMQGVPIRLAGQDSQRGTFNQRHMVWVDSESGETYCPFSRIPNARLQIVNSPLSEFAGMGFEYGYTLAASDAFVLWEAQYGDFNNGAQVIIDQYIVSGEQKWACPSSLTLLLPHAYEGAGPEHSSARIERFLQLAANANICVVNASTPAQYFHLLRRQALQKTKKPLAVFTPKSLLRLPACTSPLEAFTKGRFEEILDDPTSPQPQGGVKKLLFCSGKIYYDLLAARKRTDIALIRIEQLYPLHLEELKKLVEQYKGFRECLWVQEEPENMGAWKAIAPDLQSLLPKEVKLQFVGRPPNATTATGSNRKHKQEQTALLKQAML